MSENNISKAERREIAQDALNIGMNDPYWLSNLCRCLPHEKEAYADMLDMAEQLRADADALETAYQKVDAGEWEPAEATLYIAERANFGDYNTHKHYYDNIPIEGRDSE